VLLDKSAIYRAGIDEAYHRSNLLYDQMRMLAVGARREGEWAKEYVKHAMETGEPYEVAFYAFFAGVHARRAFSWAQRVLDLNEQRKTCGLRETDVDFTTL
jgi:hypothetical protein